MDRIAPVLKQKFWILLGIGILMTIGGWWMATSSLAATIAARRIQIDAAQKKIPSASGEFPNSEWIANLDTLNKKQDIAVKSATYGLWMRQRQRMIWPAAVAEAAWKNGYRGEIHISAREAYRIDYFEDRRRVWEVVNPVRIDGTGVVEVSEKQLPSHVFKRSIPPTSAAMWDAQEDLWIMEGLLQSISNINGGQNATRLSANVHVLREILLRGGQPTDKRTPIKYNPPGELSYASDDSNDSGQGTSQNLEPDSVRFDLSSEFGSDAAPALAIGNQVGQKIKTEKELEQADLMAGPQPLRRYIDDSADLPFMTRGFYMTLTMDHREIPALIVELTSSENSVWPVEICRIQMSRLNKDSVQTSQSYGAGGQDNTSYDDSDESENRVALSQVDDGLGGNPLGGLIARSGNLGTANLDSLQESLKQQNLSASLLGNREGLRLLLKDPNMAFVAICGIVTLYKEVNLKDLPPDVAAELQVAKTPDMNSAVADESPSEIDLMPTEERAPSTETEAEVPSSAGSDVESPDRDSTSGGN